jgi:hypothetical protein
VPVSSPWRFYWIKQLKKEKMGDLRPLGSERLQGMDKIKRIMEIARYNEAPKAEINENATTEYTVQLVDGNYYGIVREKSGYIVKQGLTESSLDYNEPMKNRKYYKSFSQAMRKINLIAGELNRLHENMEETPLIGEQKKFVLKTPKAEVPAETPAEEPAPSVEPETSVEDLDLDLDLSTDTTSDETEMGGEDMSLDMDMDVEADAEETDEELSVKTIQKLTGKLGQKLRTLDSKQGLTSEDIKYVLNSIISAVDLTKLTAEDMDDVLSNFEEDEIDYGVEDEADLDVEVGDEMDLSADLDMEPEATEGETTEGSMFLGQRQGDKDRFYDEMEREYRGDFDFDYDEEEFDDYDTFMSKVGDQKWFAPEGGRMFFDKYRDMYGPFKFRKRKEMGEGSLEDMGIETLPSMDFEEKTVELSPEDIKNELHSTIDKVLSKYFEVTDEEQQMMESKKVSKFINEKVKNVTVRKEIKKLSETVEQELTADFIIREHNNVKFLGKTNKGNLVFEADDVTLKISTKGEIL